MEKRRRKQVCKHEYAPAEAHIASLVLIGIIILTAIFVEGDATGYLTLPILFFGVILRCVWDWIYALIRLTLTVLIQVLKTTQKVKEVIVNGKISA